MRKQWLLSYIFFWCISTCAAFLNLALSTGMPIAALILTLFFSLLFFWVILHCAYQERGTKWLLFFSMILPIRMWIASKELMMEAQAVGDLRDLAIFFGIFVLILGSHLWFWICCMRYRGENLLLKRSAQNEA